MKQWKDNKGFTMVEVMVAFVILLIGMTMLLSCLKMASNIQMKAVDQKNERAEWEQAINQQLTAGEESVYNQVTAGGSESTYQFHIPGESYTIFSVKAKTGSWVISGYPYTMPVYGQ